MQDVEQAIGASGIDVGALAGQFGLSHDQANAALGALMPAVLGGFQRHADDGGVDAVAASAGSIGEPDAPTGNAILGNIFGSKDVSRQVADHAAGQSGVPATVLKAMLPIVVAMLAKNALGGAAGGVGGGAGGGLGGLLGSLLGGGGGQAGGSGLPGGLGGVLGGGNPLDTILSGLRSRS